MLPLVLTRGRAPHLPAGRLLTSGGRAAGEHEAFGGEGGGEEDGAPGGGQQLEFAYGFDVHCNSYFPLFLLLHVAQYAALPLLLGSGHVPALLSCGLYCLALSCYTYLTFLGYSGTLGGRARASAGPRGCPRRARARALPDVPPSLRAAARPSALPFLRHTEVVVLPIGAFVLLALVGVLAGLNPTRSSAAFFYAPALSDAEPDFPLPGGGRR